MSRTAARRGRAVVEALVVTLLWSSSWVIIRVGLREGLPPLTFAGLRYSVAALALWVVTAAGPPVRGRLRTLTWGRLLRLALLGILLYSLTQGAQFVAIQAQPVATTSLLLSFTPLLVAAASGRLLGERPSVAQVIGVILVPAGAASFFMGALSATTVGLAAGLVAVCANSAAALLGRSINRDPSTNPLVTTTISMSIGALVLVLGGVADQGIPTLSVRAMAIIFWLAIVNSAAAFTLWNHSLRYLSASESAIVNNTMLIQIALLGWLILGEKLAAAQWIGIVLVSAGILLGQRRDSLQQV